MSNELIILAIIVGAVLAIIIWMEYKEYKKAVKLAQGTQALGESMKITFENMADHMNRFSTIQTAMAMDAEEKDAKIQQMDLILAAHTDALSLKLLTEIARKLEGNVSGD